jgi:hypothetical protein
LSDRFGLLPDGTDFIELDRLAAYFSTLVRLPKLASRAVLLRALAEGCERQVFGLVSGSQPKAPDSVVRFGERLSDGEIQFQPGTWLVRGTLAAELKARSGPNAIDPSTATAKAATGTSSPDTGEGPAARVSSAGSGAVRVGSDSGSPAGSPRVRIGSVTVTLDDVPPDRVRDVLRAAINPLASAASIVTVGIVIRAEAESVGIPREVLDLTVLEGLRQVGLVPKIEITEL